MFCVRMRRFLSTVDKVDFFLLVHSNFCTKKVTFEVNNCTFTDFIKICEKIKQYKVRRGTSIDFKCYFFRAKI